MMDVNGETKCPLVDSQIQVGSYNNATCNGRRSVRTTCEWRENELRGIGGQYPSGLAKDDYQGIAHFFAVARPNRLSLHHEHELIAGLLAYGLPKCHKCFSRMAYQMNVCEAGKFALIRRVGTTYRAHTDPRTDIDQRA